MLHKFILTILSKKSKAFTKKRIPEHDMLFANKKNVKYDESKQNFNKFASLKRACSFFTR